MDLKKGKVLISIPSLSKGIKMNEGKQGNYSNDKGWVNIKSRIEIVSDILLSEP